MCFTLQRYKFSSKSQPAFAPSVLPARCVLPCKGTNFQANHNLCASSPRPLADVFYLAKVQIFKQITTTYSIKSSKKMMCFTLQRYKFSSKSQPVFAPSALPARCVLPCKGTNFQANHNSLVVIYIFIFDVFYLAKVQIFKQITTTT